MIHPSIIYNHLPFPGSQVAGNCPSWHWGRDSDITDYWNLFCFVNSFWNMLNLVKCILNLCGIKCLTLELFISIREDDLPTKIKRGYTFMLHICLNGTFLWCDLLCMLLQQSSVILVQQWNKRKVLFNWLWLYLQYKYVCVYVISDWAFIWRLLFVNACWLR